MLPCATTFTNTTSEQDPLIVSLVGGIVKLISVHGITAKASWIAKLTTRTKYIGIGVLTSMVPGSFLKPPMHFDIAIVISKEILNHFCFAKDRWLRVRSEDSAPSTRRYS